MATQSLYRRYRPRRFSEVKGQDHVVKAMRTAVAEGREGQAYLFSGPRGTGKTTSARILAKVLNCANPIDGEPCCECESCLAVERGTSYDVHELDAASNNGVDAMRELIERASLGTPGRHKVYILDEVHMLSKAAEAALLKTLEEPPPHVVFVLATTDPQKMSDTIRSRTQHLQFHLLAPDTLAEHVRWVATDAGLDVSDAALDQVLRQGAGSARDALSALELVASIGDDGVETVPLDEFVEAMIDRDPGRALTMVAHAIGIGRDPRTLTEELIGFMRNGFLCLMAPELVPVSGQHIDALTDQAGRLGAAGLVRGIETLGATLSDMRHAPDARVLLDVAAVQLTSDSVAPDLGALLARLHRLEEQVAAGVTVAAPGVDVTPAADPVTGRAALGGRARPAPATAPSTRSVVEPEPPSATAEPAPTAAPSVSPAVPPTVSPSVPPAVSPGGLTTDVWEQTVRRALRGMTRAVYAPATLVGAADGTATFSLPNVAHREKCEQHREAVEAAIRTATGAPVVVQLLVEGESSDVPPTPSAGPAAPSAAPTAPPDVSRRDPAAATIDETPDDDDVDLDDLVDAPPESVKSPIDRLAEAFPGSELIDERT
ncbi:MAG: DNA polymerase III subunit gamma/tau [Ilumatobacteraceae bacterium]